jgi:signal transduction histidine kinase
MNIKLKLSLQFTMLVTVILIFFAGLVYYFFYDSQLRKFRENLIDTAKNTAVLLINVVEVDSTLLKKIQQSTSSWEKEEIVLTDTTYHVIYSNKPDYLRGKVLKDNHSSGEYSYFTIAEKDGVYYRHSFKGKTYYVYAMAFDKSRYVNLAEMRKVLFWGIMISIMLSIYLSYIFSRRAIGPVTRLIQSVKKINSSKLNDRLDEGNKKDEIAQLAITFNEMLTNLEIAFSNQEDFVSNASHELRTPLTVMLMESDYLLTHEHPAEEYKAHIANQMDDIRKLNGLLNSLLELAHLNKDTSILFAQIRIDEVVFGSIQQIKGKFQGRKIVPKILYPENDTGLLVEGNAGLLTIAFNNLIENACKFSDDEVVIDFTISDETITITISDSGIGIPAGQTTDIFNPFKRATNVKFKGGFGIGLALVDKILQLHNVPIKVNSSEEHGTRFELVFQRFSTQHS